MICALTNTNCLLLHCPIAIALGVLGWFQVIGWPGEFSSCSSWAIMYMYVLQSRACLPSEGWKEDVAHLTSHCCWLDYVVVVEPVFLNLYESQFLVFWGRTKDLSFMLSWSGSSRLHLLGKKYKWQGLESKIVESKTGRDFEFHVIVSTVWGIQKKGAGYALFWMLPEDMEIWARTLCMLVCYVWPVTLCHECTYISGCDTN